jgi:hypothetical protein
MQLPVARVRKTDITGQITNPDAASRYITTCREFGFIAQIFKQVRSFRVSKIGSAISALSLGGNPFKLTQGQIFLVLKSLLEKDYDCLSLLIETLAKKRSDRIEYFQNGLENRLKLKIEKAKETNKLRLVDQLKRHSKRLRKWQKPLRYYPENIEAPRIEWLLDLNLIKYWDQRAGKVSFQDRIDVLFDSDLLSRKWLEDEFPTLFARLYSPSLKTRIANWIELDVEERVRLLNLLLKDSMERFQTTIEVGKISADEFFWFTMGFLIQNKKAIASLSNLEEDLVNFTRMGKVPYRYVQTVSPADKGYIART